MLIGHITGLARPSVRAPNSMRKDAEKPIGAKVPGAGISYKRSKAKVIRCQNKSPALARVSRPYSWCTLATCVHNCPSICFEHVVACARNVNVVTCLFPIQVKRPIPPRNTCVANCGQTAAVSDMVTIDSLYELTNALSNGTVAGPLRRTV